MENKEKEKLTRFDDYKKNIPLNYVHRLIRDYLYHNNYPLAYQRLMIIKALLDSNRQFTFNDIRQDKNKTVTQYDNRFIFEFFDDYMDHFAPLSSHKSKKDYITDSYSRLINEISDYVLGTKRKDIDRKKRDKRFLVYVDKILKENADLEKLEQQQLDNLYPTYDEQRKWIHKISVIPDKKSKKESKKDYPSWEGINELKDSYENMNDEQKQLYDVIELNKAKIANDSNMSVKVKVELYRVNRELREIINKIHYYKKPTLAAERSGNNQVFRFEGNDEYFAKQILDILDYSNPKHISALIQNFNDLRNKHGSSVDNPLHTILNEFQAHVSKMNFSEKHKKIIDTYMFVSSDKKEVARLLDMDTDLLQKTLSRTISKNISKYFIKNVGK